MSTAFTSISPSDTQSISIIPQSNTPANPPAQTTKRASAPQLDAAAKDLPALHRVAEVRQQQGLSLRTVSRRTGIEVKELRQQEVPKADMLLSNLLLWQKALDVPLVDLLEDEGQPLSRPVKERAKLVRIMKTAVSIAEASEGNVRLQRLAQMLREQLIELMPELTEIGGWPQCGSRRGADVMGRVFHEPISIDADCGE